jgi:uncharacterized protein (TIGR00661 family)
MFVSKPSKKILVAPLNWGLGHAARCIPIIKSLIKTNFEPIIASDGEALLLLQKEFPKLRSFQLPSYNITYSRHKYLKYKLLLKIPGVLKTINQEKKIIKRIVDEVGASGIISDNRFGARDPRIPSIYITHQLKVFSGCTTAITTKFHNKIISKFDSCWVPDNFDGFKLSGQLSGSKNIKTQIKFIGPLSRFKYHKTGLKNDVLILLSGPEPQRSILETKLLNQLRSFDKKVLFVRGVFSNKKLPYSNKNIKLVNFMLCEELQIAMNESKLILSRSGYSTIMDLSILKKKAFFIPTPGQYEQEYLAKRMNKYLIAPYAEQDDFELKMLEKGDEYNGFENLNPIDLNTKLFELF